MCLWVTWTEIIFSKKFYIHFNGKVFGNLFKWSYFQFKEFACFSSQRSSHGRIYSLPIFQSKWNSITTNNKSVCAFEILDSIRFFRLNDGLDFTLKYRWIIVYFAFVCLFSEYISEKTCVSFHLDATNRRNVHTFWLTIALK